MGTLDPRAVYGEPAAWQRPWRFALIHAALFAGSCTGSIINWRLHESARDSERMLTSTMAHRASHDGLTGLPNRAQLLDRGKQILGESAGTSRPTALLMLDLDRFKEINDVLEHAYGDVLLRRLGPLLAPPCASTTCSPVSVGTSSPPCSLTRTSRPAASSRGGS